LISPAVRLRALSLGPSGVAENLSEIPGLFLTDKTLKVTLAEYQTNRDTPSQADKITTRGI
jgi:hypothetical protein